MLTDPVILTNDLGRAFVLGLHWKRIVATGAESAEKEARSYALQNKANRMVLARGSRGDVGAVGCTRLPPKEPTVLSLACALTLQYEPKDKVIAAVKLGNGDVWVCAMADGLIVNGFDLVLGEDAAFAKVRQFIQRYAPGIVLCLGDALAEAQVLTLQDLFDVALAHEHLCRVESLSASREDRKRYLAIGAVLLAILGGNYGWTTYNRYRAAQQADLDELNRAPELTAQQAWNKVVAQWQSTTVVATPQALNQVLDALVGIPLEVAGWRTTDVSCIRSEARWNCTVSFTRLIDLRATTQALLAGVPSGWVVDWGGLNNARARFAVPAAVEPPIVAKLPAAQAVSLPLLAQLQRNSRAFTSAELGSAAAVKLPPALDGEGKPMTLNPDTVKPVLVSLPLNVSGPLRSLYLLDGAAVSWTSIKLSIDRFSGAEGDPAKSALTIKEAKGELYAVK